VAAAAGAAAAAVAAGAGKDKSTNVNGNEYPSFFCYTVMDGDLYPDVIMMSQIIDLKSEHLNPIHDLQDERDRNEMSNFTSVMFNTAACRLVRHQRTDIYDNGAIHMIC
jgi:hypothetical protein